jgi:hypothetical protein
MSGMEASDKQIWGLLVESIVRLKKEKKMGEIYCIKAITSYA